jgi:GH25 family lysozyme M1 (1,4-beta-N-acetylmuramidase)
MIPGIDVSFWQGVVDWDKAASKVHFAFLRAGQNRSIDKWFRENWPKSKGALLRDAYWFYDWRVGMASPEVQGGKLREARGNDGDMGGVMDFENPYQGWSSTPFPNKVTSVNLMRRFRNAAQLEHPILYTNAATLQYWGELPQDIRDEWYLWVAAWPRILRAGKWDAIRNFSEIPNGWIPATYGWPYTFWQYTCKLDGNAHGMQGKDLDGNVFMGTVEELAETFGLPPVIPPEPPEPPEPPDPPEQPSGISGQLAGLADDIKTLRNRL